MCEPALNGNSQCLAALTLHRCQQLWQKALYFREMAMSFQRADEGYFAVRGAAMLAAPGDGPVSRGSLNVVRAALPRIIVAFAGRNAG